MSEDTNKEFIEIRDKVLEDIISFLDDPEQSSFEFSEPGLTEDLMKVRLEKREGGRLDTDTYLYFNTCPVTGINNYIVLNMFIRDRKLLLKRSRKATDQLAKMIMMMTVFNPVDKINVVTRSVPNEDLTDFYSEIEYFITLSKRGAFIHSEGDVKGEYLAFKISEEERSLLLADIEDGGFLKPQGEGLNG